MTIEFGVARSVDAQSFGEPGQRTFRLRILGSESQSASVWLEKEQVMALALALRQALSQLKFEDEPREVDIGGFPGTADHDFRAGNMGMGFDPSNRTVVLQIHESGLGEDAEPTLRVRLTLELCSSLATRTAEIIARGRPICPLCRLPMDPSGHVCVRSNGHTMHPIPEEDSGDRES